MKKSYMSPIVRFEKLQLRENIADRCWAFDKDSYNESLYYDTAASGYTKFSITGKTGNCGNNKQRTFTVEYASGDDALTVGGLSSLGPNHANIYTYKPGSGA